MQSYPSIFNDVLAPVTFGPSSSNTCGVFRIARTATQIFKERIENVTIEMSNMGAFKSTFYGMKSDLAFVAGLLLKDSSTYALDNAYEDAKKAGMTVEVLFTDEMPGEPHELVRMHLSNKNKSMIVTGESIGGGGFIISRIDDYPVDIRGKEFLLLIFMTANENKRKEKELTAIISSCSSVNEVAFSKGASGSLVVLHSAKVIPDSIIKEIQALPFVMVTSSVSPEYKMVFDKGKIPIFKDYQGMLHYVKRRSVPLWQAALDYEVSVSGLGEEKVWALANEIFELSMKSVEGGFAEGLSFKGIVQPCATELKNGFDDSNILKMGFLEKAVPAALSVMEFSNAHGQIVCMPTGGSSGVIPGLLYALREDYHKETLVKALLVSGLMGLFMYETNYSGAIGCQAEIGCATSMAAAGLSFLLGDDVERTCNAASLALQSLLGLICDPVAGLVQVPCMIRNMIAVSVAATVANAAHCNYPATVPFDEMVTALLAVGERIRFNSTCGTCATETGIKLEMGGFY